LKKHQSNIERKNKIIRWINIQQRTIKVILANFLIEGLGNAKKKKDIWMVVDNIAFADQTHFISEK
jgi:hypothetical protein